jgi:hypothetical protein
MLTLLTVPVYQDQGVCANGETSLCLSTPARRHRGQSTLSRRLGPYSTLNN